MHKRRAGSAEERRESTAAAKGKKTKIDAKGAAKKGLGDPALFLVSQQIVQRTISLRPSSLVFAFRTFLGAAGASGLRERKRERERREEEKEEEKREAECFFLLGLVHSFPPFFPPQQPPHSACASPFFCFFPPSLFGFHSPWLRATTSGTSRPRSLSRRTPRTCAPTTR